MQRSDGPPAGRSGTAAVRGAHVERCSHHGYVVGTDVADVLTYGDFRKVLIPANIGSSPRENSEMFRSLIDGAASRPKSRLRSTSSCRLPPGRPSTAAWLAYQTAATGHCGCPRPRWNPRRSSRLPCSSGPHDRPRRRLLPNTHGSMVTHKPAHRPGVGQRSADPCRSPRWPASARPVGPTRPG